MIDIQSLYSHWLWHYYADSALGLLVCCIRMIISMKKTYFAFVRFFSRLTDIFHRLTGLPIFICLVQSFYEKNQRTWKKFVQRRNMFFSLILSFQYNILEVPRLNPRNSVTISVNRDTGYRSILVNYEGYYYLSSIFSRP